MFEPRGATEPGCAVKSGTFVLRFFSAGPSRASGDGGVSEEEGTLVRGDKKDEEQAETKDK